MDDQRFEDEGEVGHGGMGTVRRALDRRLLRRVAIKVCDATNDAEERRRFVEEAQVMAQLDHPNIVPVHDLEPGAPDRPPCFVMKLVEGRTLGALLAERQEPPVAGPELDELLRVFGKVCEAVSFAHSRGIVHRDLNPTNVMVGTYGQVYVMDWGLALSGSAGRPVAATAAVAERSGTFGGTPAYLAPEQAEGRVHAIDERTDVFGLGGILYQLLTLRPPHGDGTVDDVLERARAGRVPAPDAVAGGRRLPPGLCTIAMRALAPDPSDRHQSVEALRVAVEEFRRGGGWFATVRFAPGTVILREAETGTDAYIVTEGRCVIYRGSGGDRVPLREVGPGEVFGEISLVTNVPRTATVEAQTDVSALLVTREALEQELQGNSWMRAFIRAGVERFAELDRLVGQKDPTVP
jgi:serine/threonine-protein kinase